jgi:hypothetical protein
VRRRGQESATTTGPRPREAQTRTTISWVLL